ncbi:MAG TPA: hypothetical protein DHL02_26975, partial [Achromobacter sp.]|nr:hypothetical protein [Achromobacter sp.]
MPDAEVKHLAPKRRSKGPMWVLLLLLLCVVGAGMWAVFDTPALPDVVARADAPDASARVQSVLPTAAMAPAPSAPEPPTSNAATIVEDHPLAQLTRDRDRDAG